MRLLHLLTAGLLAPITVLAAPTGDNSGFLQHYKRENLCNLKSPPSICQPNSSVTVEETALRAYKFYRAFVVDGDPRTMFSLIDSSYIVSERLQATRWKMQGVELGLRQIANTATSSRLQQRAADYLVSLLQRQQDRHRGQHGLVLRCQHQHVVRAVLDDRSVEVG